MHDDDQPRRRRPAHHSPVESGNRAVIVFVTVCSSKRQPLFANPNAVRLITEAWKDAQFWKVGRFAILPDHIHFFCAPGTSPPHPLKTWMSYWQNLVTRSWPDRDQLPLWQQDCWDRQLRRDESYAAKWEYVRNNPVRHRLVTQCEDWPYQGELNVLDWHDE